MKRNKKNKSIKKITAQQVAAVDMAKAQRENTELRL
jgi:hypothetical protein